MKVPIQGTSIADCLFLYQTIMDNQYHNVLEIGSMFGSSTIWILKALQEVESKSKKMLKMVDADIDEWGGRGDSQRYFRNSILKELNNDHGLIIQNIHSTSDEYFEEKNANEKFDIVFVDANHSEEGTDRDIENALKASSHVLVHDYFHDEGTKASCDKIIKKNYYNCFVHKTERGIFEIIK